MIVMTLEGQNGHNHSGQMTIKVSKPYSHAPVQVDPCCWFWVVPPSLTDAFADGFVYCTLFCADERNLIHKGKYVILGKKSNLIII